MKKLLPVLLALLLLGGLMLAGCGEDETTTTASTPQATTATTAAAGETYYIRWAQFATAVLADSQPVIKMAENIKTRTNGRCTVELFWSDSLVPMFESMDAVRLGSAEMATFPFGPFGGMDARFTSSEMPLYYNTIEAQVEAQAALMPAYTGVFEEKFNQKALGVRSILPLNLGSAKKPVKVMADWDGLLTQTISPAVTAIIENFGAVGAPASPLDVYELLQKGTVDATIQSLGKFVEAKLWEVCDNLTNCMFISASAATTINLDMWNKLPKDIQDIILEEAAIAEEAVKQISIDTYKSYLVTLGENMEVYNLPKVEREKWQAALKPVVDGMLGSMGDFANDVIKTADEANAKYPYPY
jgi:TRAP-type transport system periplasmic protein